MYYVDLLVNVVIYRAIFLCRLPVTEFSTQS